MNRLWLDLVTIGIQDLALAFEPGEGHELERPPREAMFNRIMIERVLISAIVIGVVAFGLFKYLLDQGFSVEQARNKLLPGGTIIAQLVHIGAMYTPWLGDVLGASPVSLAQWLILLGLALLVMAVMELHKYLRARLTKKAVR